LDYILPQFRVQFQSFAAIFCRRQSFCDEAAANQILRSSRLASRQPVIFVPGQPYSSCVAALRASGHHTTNFFKKPFKMSPENSLILQAHVYSLTATGLVEQWFTLV
jgi:hypothetical protein